MAHGDAGRLVGPLVLAACAAAIVAALTLSAAAAAGQWLPQPTVAARPPSGPTWAAPPDRGTTDLGTAYDPFVIGWRAGPAAAPTRGLGPSVAPPAPTPTDR